MFQIVQDELKDKTKEETNNKNVSILTNAMSKKYILLYIITLMASTIGIGQAFSPFSLAMVVAIGANEIPIVLFLVVGLIGNIIGCGVESILPYIITLLVFFASFFAIEPKYNDESRNEKIKYGGRILAASLIVNLISVFISGFLIYDVLVAITISMITYVLYKVFVNSITLFINFTQSRAFTFEEVIGAGILLTVAACAIGDIQFIGFSIRNIVAIFIILLLGWKNGMLVGTTSGVTIGVTLGIITGSDPVAIAAYAMAGLIAGLLSKLGRIAVIIGFIIGDIILTYLSNGGIENLIVFQEILIAGAGLLAIPKGLNLNIQNMVGDNRFLPDRTNRTLDKSMETVQKLEDVSKAVEDMAESYNHIVSPEDNKQIFIMELLNYTENLEENILFDQISKVDGKIVNDIFNELLEKQSIKEKDLLRIFANNNNYVVGFSNEETAINRDVTKMTQAINSAYRVSKVNFIWDNKLKEEKENIKTQLSGVSKAISNIAEQMKEKDKKENLFEDEKERIKLLLKQKEILVQDISIEKCDDNKFAVDIYVEENEKLNVDEIISNIITKTLNEKVIVTKSEHLKNEKCEKYTFYSDDKFVLDIGQALAVKDDMPVSGDSVLQVKLKDGKYLVAISDGMGSGPDAKKSSQIVVTMLQKLLNSGFNKETSIDLINSNLLNVREDVFATLDIAIIDLYNGTIEFIKSGAAPTYIKTRRRTQIIKSSALPAGILQYANKEVFDRDIENGDLIVMCSDGIIDSNIEYKNKALWVKYLLEDMENNNSQKIADIILQESIDNNFGKIKDDMSVVVCKITTKI